MSIPVQIHVEMKRTNRFVAFLAHASFWVLLVGAIAVSRVWLGGSFLVELFAAVLAIVVLGKAAATWSGKMVTMHVSELEAWFNDGAPADVDEWRAARSAKPVRSRS